MAHIESETPSEEQPLAETTLIPPESSSSETPQTGGPSNGQRWMGQYQIEEKSEDYWDENTWVALHPAASEKVLILRVQTSDPLHGDAWERLHQIDSPRILAPRDSRLLLEERYEIFRMPEGPTLRTWLRGKPAQPASLITTWAGNLAEALGQLHSHSLVHGHLSPDTVLVEADEKGKPVLTIAGGNLMLRSDRADLAVIEPDPFYAPPESVGQIRHEPGEGLKAWDWWSVGRILQELVLGRHILEHLLDHPLKKEDPEDRDFAEKLLLEKAHGNTKAGGLEAMPAIDKRLDLLLHGLLTGSRDGRWTGDDVRLWLKGESPRERYTLSRTEKLFKWRGRCYTLQEAAEVFRLADNWENAQEQITNRNDPESLVSFIRSQPQLRLVASKIDDSLAIASASDLKSFSALVIREVAVACALRHISGGFLVFRGKRVDNSLIKLLLDQETGTGENLQIVQVLSSAQVLPPLEKLDFEAFRVLSEGSRLAAKATEKAVRMGLLQKTNLTDLAKIWSLAFDSPSAWLEQIKELRGNYARSEKPHIQELFEKERALPEETLILAWLIPNAMKLGFISHADWSKREHKRLQERGGLLAKALFWLRLWRSLELGTWWFGRMGLLLGGWGVLTMLFALAWPGPGYSPLLLLPIPLAIAFRAALKSIVQPLVTTHAPNSRPWGNWDGTERCRVEAARIQESRLPVSDLKAQLREVNDFLAKLTHLTPPPKPIPFPPSMLALKVLASMSWVFLFAPAGLALRTLQKAPNPWITFVRAWVPPEIDLEYYEPEPEVKIEFPLTVPKRQRVVTALSVTPVTELQKKLGLKRGKVLTYGYITETIPAPVIVRVPSEYDFSFVIYDAKRGDLTNKNVYHLQAPPKRRTCVSIEGKPAFVLEY